MRDNTYNEYSARISTVHTSAERDALAAELTREPKDDDRDALLRSLGQHSAIFGLVDSTPTGR